MRTIYTKITKLSVIAMIIGMAAGCASVTDATLPEQADQPAAGTITAPDTPTPVGFGGNDVSPILDKPR